MEKLALGELEQHGYTEDLASKKAFERRYLPLTIPGVLLCFGPYPFTRFVWSPFSDPTAHFFALVFCFLLGFGLCLGAAVHAMDSIPTSRHSGAPMQRFVRSDAEEGTTEYIYIDHPSRTYFSRVVAVPSSA